MTNLLKSRLPAFQHAFEGIVYVLKSQKNAWIHFVATILVILLIVLLKISIYSTAILILVTGLVWAAEIFNTAIEAVVDLLSPDHHPLAKIAKDTGAAAVLVSAIVAMIIGIILLGPPLVTALKILISR